MLFLSIYLSSLSFYQSYPSYPFYLIYPIYLDNLWITPSYQSQGLALEAICMLLEYLFSSGYRRVSVSIDSRHVVARKLFEKAGFALESIMRKARVVSNRNSDRAIYVMLNSEWEASGRGKLVTLTGLGALAPKSKSVVSIEYDQTKHYLENNDANKNSGNSSNTSCANNKTSNDNSNNNSNSSSSSNASSAKTKTKTNQKKK